MENRWIQQELDLPLLTQGPRSYNNSKQQQASYNNSKEQG